MTIYAGGTHVTILSMFNAQDRLYDNILRGHTSDNTIHPNCTTDTEQSHESPRGSFSAAQKSEGTDNLLENSKNMIDNLQQWSE